MLYLLRDIKVKTLAPTHHPTGNCRVMLFLCRTLAFGTFLRCPLWCSTLYVQYGLLRSSRAPRTALKPESPVFISLGRLRTFRLQFWKHNAKLGHVGGDRTLISPLASRPAFAPTLRTSPLLEGFLLLKNHQ